MVSRIPPTIKKTFTLSSDELHQLLRPFKLQVGVVNSSIEKFVLSIKKCHHPILGVYYQNYATFVFRAARRQKRQRRLMIKKASENLSLTSTRLLTMSLTPPTSPVSITAHKAVTERDPVLRIDEENVEQWP